MKAATRSEDNTLNLLNKQLSNLSADNQYVTFKIGEENYGIDIMLVQEMIRYEKPTRLFNSNPLIDGVINFRGRIIPIVNMHKKFNLKDQVYDTFTVVIIIEVKNKTLGMIVDAVSDIYSFDGADIQEVDKEFAEDIKGDHIKAIGKSGKQMVMLLDPEKVMSIRDYESVESVIVEQQTN